jgi:hypothetical protein
MEDVSYFLELLDSRFLFRYLPTDENLKCDFHNFCQPTLFMNG